ncbi:hypothetical protein [Serratia marcescens]|uniref:hypothetical protein n=1 Tax=Serratia marcescens TaxID=615 RepID=UPI00214B973D|nr:hypothetical protein [Serratia marcescens]
MLVRLTRPSAVPTPQGSQPESIQGGDPGALRQRGGRAEQRQGEQSKGGDRVRNAFHRLS